MQHRDQSKRKVFARLLLFSLFALLFMLPAGSNVLSNREVSYAQESANLFSDIFKSLRGEKVPSHSLEVANENRFVVPMGTPIGIKLTTEGVLVTGFSQIKGQDGKDFSPARQAGIEINDVILYIDDVLVESAEQISDYVRNSNGGSIYLAVKRNGEILMQPVTPVYADGCYKLCMYVRNVSAGIGTLTFVNPQSKTFAALGHGITDMDTGKFLNLSQGAITKSYILSAAKGEKGQAGELRGILTPDSPNTGEILSNGEIGVYGRYHDETDRQAAVPIAEIEEIQTGPAQVLTTITGSQAQYYDIEVVKIVKQTRESQKSMVIRVTDPRLLTKTGGIVQGMSGSPILQNGKLIGAVTHVFVNDPTCGYAVFAKWMDQKTQQIAS